MRQFNALKLFIVFAGVAVIGGAMVLEWHAWPASSTIVQPSSSPPSTMEQSHGRESGETINQWQEKFIQQQTTIESLFRNYNSCLPRFTAPKYIEEDNFNYSDLVEVMICTHDVIRKFAREMDNIKGESNFIRSLRFGTCDECSEARPRE